LKKIFLGNIIFALLANFLVKPIWIFAIDKNVQVAIGHESYGIYAALVNLAIVFNYLLDFGLTNFNSVEVAENKDRFRSLFKSILVTKTFFFSIYLIVVSMVFYISGYPFQIYPLILSVLTVQFLSSVLTFFRSSLAALHFYKTDTLMSILDKLFLIIFFLVISFFPGIKPLLNINNYVSIQAAAYCLAIIIALLFLKPHLKNLERANWLDIKLTLIKGAPYALLIFLMSLHMRSDLFLLERLHPYGKFQAGQYAYCYRLLDAFNMIGVLFAGLLLPMFSRAKDSRVNTEDLIQLSAKLLLTGSLLVAGFGWFYSKEILQLLGNGYDEAMALCMRFLLASFPAWCVMNIFSTWLTAAKKIKLLIIIATFGALLSIGLNSLLLPHVGFETIAASAMLVQSLLGLSYILFTIKFAQLSYLKTLLPILTAGIIFFGLNYFCFQTNLEFESALLANLFVYLVLVLILVRKQFVHLLQYLKA
jgi:O-antigen/teichoic acid export membrane protein